MEASEKTSRETARILLQRGVESTRRDGDSGGVLYGRENEQTEKVVGGKPERGGTADTQRGGSNSDGRNVNYSISVDDVSDSRADIVSNEKYQKLVEDLKRKYQHAKETLPSVGIGNKSHTPIIESNASDISIADLSLFVNFKIIKKNAPCKGCINIISKIRLLSAPRLLFR